MRKMEEKFERHLIVRKWDSCPKAGWRDARTQVTAGGASVESMSRRAIFAKPTGKRAKNTASKTNRGNYEKMAEIPD